MKETARKNDLKKNPDDLFEPLKDHDTDINEHNSQRELKNVPIQF